MPGTAPMIPQASAPLTGERLFQALGDNAYELDAEFRFLTYNAGCEAYYGRPAPRVLGRPIWDALPETRGSPLEPLLRSTMADRLPRRVEIAGIVRPDRWVEVTVFPTEQGIGVAFRDRTAEHGAAEALRNSEARYRALFDNVDEGFCIIEMLFDRAGQPEDYRFLEVNAAFERQTGLRAAAGRRMRELAAAHEQHWFDIYGEVALTGEPRRFVNRAEALGGRWFDVYAFRIGRAEDRQVAILFSDVTERRRTDAALRASEERQAFLLRLSDAMRPLVDPDAVKQSAVELLGRHLGVNRAHYVEVLADGNTLEAGPGYVDGVPGVTGRLRLSDYGRDIAADFRTGRILLANDVLRGGLDEAQARACEAIQLRAAIGVPLLKGGRLVAVLAVHHATPREWTAAEVELVGEVAERTWEAAERARADAALRESEERLRLIVESARDYAIFTADPDGLIDSWPPGAAAVFGWSAEEAIGQPIAITFTPEDRAAGIPDREMATACREGTAPDVRWHVRNDGSRVFIEGSMTALRDPAGGVRGFLKIGQDITHRMEAEARQALLAREVDHRARNVLALVQSIMRQTSATTVEEFVRVVGGRVAALARTHSLLSKERWIGADLREIIQAELRVFAIEGKASRIVLDGPAATVPPEIAQALAMIVHELSTNAAKYGALSVPAGQLTVSWTLDGNAGDQVLRLRWSEAGGPELTGEPAHQGFGSALVRGMVEGQLRGVVRQTWARTGLVCEMEIPLEGGAGAADAD